MEAIRSLVQNIIIIVILAVFLEMFLPGGELKKYVKMVMGLLIIIAVVQAVGAMARWDYSGTLSSITGEGDKTRVSGVIEAGKKISGDQEQIAIEQYRTGIARQVTALTSIYKETRVVDVDVKVQSNSGQPDYGQIKEIVLYVAQNAGEPQAQGGITIEEVEPVTVIAGGGDEAGASMPAGTGPPRDTVSGLIGTVANFYSLGQEQVKVIYR
ncbi:stage III sporulation protein AF [Pelotomaculum propionicicum]|uniref:stage III sporulation protein AF n=1 Tax=Pelotomaculum propionicicum TaxID=258475 RepID=UPI003B7A9056